MPGNAIMPASSNPHALSFHPLTSIDQQNRMLKRTDKSRLDWSSFAAATGHTLPGTPHCLVEAERLAEGCKCCSSALVCLPCIAAGLHRSTGKTDAEPDKLHRARDGRCAVCARTVRAAQIFPSSADLVVCRGRATCRVILSLLVHLGIALC